MFRDDYAHVRARRDALACYADVLAFHRKFELEYVGPPRKLPDDLLVFRLNFLREETNETGVCWNEGDRAGALDGLVDLAYVALGTAHLMGTDPTIRRVLSVPYIITEKGDDLGDQAVRACLVRAAQVCDALNTPIRSYDGVLRTQDELLELAEFCRAAAHMARMDYDTAWSRVHEANMQKIRTARVADSKRGSSYDVVKPLGWVAPDLSDLV